MKNKIDLKIVVIILLIIILSVMLYFYFREDNTAYDMPLEQRTESMNSEGNTQITNSIIKTTAEIISALTENIELHATYYLEECFVEENQSLQAGDNILEYSNGTYLVAPYDCVINEINIPDVNNICTSEHYVQISSNNNLAVQIQVDESIIDEISIGQEAQIEVPAFEDKKITGKVTKISNTASGGKFTVTIEFQGDKEIKIGMSANVEITQ